MLERTMFWMAVIGWIGVWILVFFYLGEKMFYRLWDFIFLKDVGHDKKEEEEEE